MGQSYETAGRTTMADLATKQPHEPLLQLGGALAVLLSLVLFAIAWSQGNIGANQLSPAVTTLVINVVLGGALLVSSAIVKKSLLNGGMIAGRVGNLLNLY